jgi:hypothetical protein
VEVAIRFVEADFRRQPRPEEIVRSVRRGKLIPCHRYHWGTVREKAMLGWQAAHAGR